MKKYIILLLLLLVQYALVAQKAIDLKLNLKKGQTFTLEQLSDQDISQTIMGMEQDMKQKFGFTYLYKVLATDGDAYTLKITYEKIYYFQKSPMQEVEYDSENPPATIAPEAQGFAGLLGEGFNLIINKNGKVLDVTGTEKMINNMVDKMDVPESIRPSMKESLNKNYGKEVMKSEMQTVFDYFPKSKVKVGDKWQTKSLKNSGIMKLNLDNEMTLKDIKNNVAYIDIQSQITSEKNKPMVLGNGISAEYDLKGTQKSTIQININTGMVINLNYNQDVSGMMNMISGQLPGGKMDVPIKMLTNNTIKDVK